MLVDELSVVWSLHSIQGYTSILTKMPKLLILNAFIVSEQCRKLRTSVV